MSVMTWARQFTAAAAEELPGSVFRYALATSGVHQLLLLALTVSVSLLEIVPLELQRRIVDDLVKNRPYSLGDHPVRRLCRGRARPRAEPSSASTSIADGSASAPCETCAGGSTRVIEAPAASSPAAEAQGIAVSMIVAEVEPIGGFVGEQRLGAAAAGRHPGLGVRLSDPPRSVDGARRVCSIYPPVLFCSADAGGGELARWSPRPGTAAARDRRDRPDRRTFPRRRTTDRPSLRPRHGDFSVSNLR